jgi:hypothetical protein
MHPGWRTVKAIGDRKQATRDRIVLAWRTVNAICDRIQATGDRMNLG